MATTCVSASTPYSTTALPNHRPHHRPHFHHWNSKPQGLVYFFLSFYLTSTHFPSPSLFPINRRKKNRKKSLHLLYKLVLIPILLLFSFRFSRNLRKSSIYSGITNASYFTDFASREPGSITRRGIWSIRDDLLVPSSPYAQGGQGPSPMVHERFHSVVSQLFQHRIIRCGGPIEDDMANIIVSQLLYLDAVDPKKDIVIYINSPGGSVTAGMAVFDTIRHIRPDVSTVCVGLAASMGAFLLSCGTKGKRFSLPNSRMMIHQPLGGAQGSQTDVDIQANEMLHHKAALNGYLSYHTGQSVEKINQDTDRDFFMSAKEAKEYGLVDAVITNPLKALTPPPQSHIPSLDSPPLTPALP